MSLFIFTVSYLSWSPSMLEIFHKCLVILASLFMIKNEATELSQWAVSILSFALGCYRQAVCQGTLELVQIIPQGLIRLLREKVASLLPGVQKSGCRFLEVEGRRGLALPACTLSIHVDLFPVPMSLAVLLCSQSTLCFLPSRDHTSRVPSHCRGVTSHLYGLAKCSRAPAASQTALAQSHGLQSFLLPSPVLEVADVANSEPFKVSAVRISLVLRFSHCQLKIWLFQVCQGNYPLHFCFPAVFLYSLWIYV